MTAAALNVYVGAGVLQLVGGQGTAGALAVVGPRYREATSIFDRAREAAAKLDDAVEKEDCIDSVLLRELNDDLLRACKYFHCEVQGAIFPLHPTRGATVLPD
mmetsp:Transcript_18550/g.63848  ORF Transcript_18550/g.63848 Transcript_18550/m.63848 type:complete len:103 (+) Transcript_18550:372-680(+)